MRILITAGPTREYFDPVRYLSNASTGKMGYAIAAEAVRRGYQAVLVTGPVSLPVPQGVRVEHIVSAVQMLEAAVRAFEECDAAVMAAAVCDYTPVEPSKQKMQRSGGWRPELAPTRDICAELGRRKGKRVLVGFALEDHDERRRAEVKLRQKNCDALVLNGVATVGSESGEIQLLRAGGTWSEVIRGSKVELAARVVDLVVELVSDWDRGPSTSPQRGIDGGCPY
ncbi:MAG TPA: phosphopantothenoylcysteine decarboxylase [Phycisphaerae bacterium]|nr:phosphopantothenoylcysteine decarboxylase [Phycisphaerae bacterium]HNU46508.1 phosphopantothenoylcysteine decarboxylase [Phycisphaerae bacterium]